MKNEYEELAESVVAMMDSARHELNVSFAAGHNHAAALLEYGNALQMAADFLQKRMPSYFRVN